MKKCVISAFLFSFILLFSNSAAALIVGYQDISFQFPIYGNQIPFTHYNLRPGILSRDTWVQYNPFGTVEVYAAGDTFEADNTTDHFANAVSLLTNGITDYIHGGWPYPDFPPESEHLYGPGFTGTDFSGLQIDKITLVVNSFDFEIYEPTTGGVGGGSIGYKITYESTAPIPEPATMILLASGLMGLTALRRRFKKS